MSLLKQTRRLNAMQQRSDNEEIKFEEVCQILSEELDCNVYIVSRKGQILGQDNALAFTTVDAYKEMMRNGELPAEYAMSLLSVTETTTNLSADDELVLNFEKGLDLRQKLTTVIPIEANRERLGTLLVNFFERKCQEEDLVLLEQAATIIALEILRKKQSEFEEDTRKRQVVELALNTLSYSEAEAINHIFDELDGNEGLLVASKIADKVGITRSVIVNALRKFESAGVIKSRSLGMKGTHITILNDKLAEGLAKRKETL